ncbi:MAG: hypothetical protein WBW48_06450 [Anaerolineae bacterium]
MRKKHWSILGLALGVLVLGVVVGLMTVNTVAADPTPGVRIQIPRIDVGDALGICTDTCDACEDLCDHYSPRYDYDECAACEANCEDCVQDNYWETWIQVQNVGDEDTGAIFFGWGEYSELCPSNAPGPIVHYCALIPENALWTLRGQIKEGVRSGIIYSVRADAFQEACDDAAWAQGNTHRWLEWEKEWANGDGIKFDLEGRPAMTWGPAPGEDLAVTVTRYGPNDYGTFVSSTYTGISEDMEGADPPYEYYAPYVMKGYNGLDTELTIQNSGQLCTSVWIDYLEQGSCYTVYKQHIEQLAPGEAVRVKVPCSDVGAISCYWLGSAHISAEVPLGIIVDQTTFELPCPGGPDPGTLLTYRARPKVEVRDSQIVTDTLVYADLIFREWSGWEASIQVQNLSRTGQRTFVTVDFMDNSGDEILFLADWVCPPGSTTFYLPPVYDLGFNYVGAAEIQSHDQVSFPGEVTPAQPIFAVVDLKKADDPFTTQLDAKAGSYNAHPYSQKVWVDEIALPFMAKDASNMYTPWTSMIAIRNNSNCNKIRPKIWFKDETGVLLCELQIPWLQPKHVKLIDLDNVGCLYPGYIGAAKVIIEPEEVEQLCDKDNDGHADNEPIMPSVIVVDEGVGGIAGDTINVYEGIPYSTGDKLCDADLLGTVRDANLMTLLDGVTVTVPGGKAEYWYNPLTMRWEYTYKDAIGTTGPGGMYEIEDIVTFGTLEPAGTCYTVTASLEDFLCSYRDVCLHCGEDKVLDFGLICDTNTWYGTVKQWVATPEDGAPPIKDATVTANWTAYPDTCDDGVTITATNAAGYFHFTQELPKDVDITLTISKDGYDVVTHTHKFEGLTCGETYFFTDTNHSTDPDWIALNCWAEVSGVVWNDINNNNQLDLGEPLLPGATCTLYTDGMGKILDTKLTDEYGVCRFDVGHDKYPDFDFTTNNDLEIGVGAMIKSVDDVKPCEVRIVNFPL